MGEAAFEAVNQPIQVEERRVSGLRFGDGRVQALLSAVLLFVFVANGFSAKDLRPKLAALLGLRADQLSAGRLTYDLRRLRLHGLIERVAGTHRYRLTKRGIQIAAFWTRAYNRLLRPGLAQLADPACDPPPLRRELDALHTLREAGRRWRALWGTAALCRDAATMARLSGGQLRAFWYWATSTGRPVRRDSSAAKAMT